MVVNVICFSTNWDIAVGLIRTLMAIAVLTAHAGPIFGLDITYLTGGQISVQIFYMISGFYMALVLNTKYTFKNSYLTFIGNRFLRLYPSYIVVVAVTFLLFFLFRSWKGISIIPFDSWKEYDLSLITIIFFIFGSIVFIGQDWAMFFGVDPQSGNLLPAASFTSCELPAYKFLFVPQAWTLGLEITFYLIAPFIVRRKTFYIVLLAFASFLTKFVLNKYFGLARDPWSYRFFPGELTLFLLGALSYKFYCFLKIREKRYLNSYVCISVWAVIITILLFYRLLPHPKLPYRLYDSVCLLIPLALPFIFHVTKNLRYDKFIGELSYPIYISHLIVVLGLKALNIETVTSNIGIITLFVTIAAALGLLMFVDRPIDKFRQTVVARRKKAAG